MTSVYWQRAARLWYRPVLARLLASRWTSWILLGAATAQVVLSSAGVSVMPCPLPTTLHIPCPGCGMTRGVQALLTGNVYQAIQWHAFAPIALCALAILGINGILTDAYRTRLLAKIEILETRTSIVQSLFLCLWIYWIVRLLWMPGQVAAILQHAST